MHAWLIQEGSDITITVSLRGFNSSSTKKHGFHVHQEGNLGNQCSDAGGHYNPEGNNHGGPMDIERYA